MFRSLNADKIRDTIQELENRITARFPGSGLSKMCAELTAVAGEADAHIRVLSRPNYWLRGLLVATLLLGVYALAHVRSVVELKLDANNLSGVLQVLDAGFNVIVIMGAGALFLTSLEARWKRQRAMEYLHDLRSIIHVIDMAQLTKDPSTDQDSMVTLAGGGQRPLTAFELARYLDYCSEMLSLSAKVAALYAQSTRDDVVIDAVSDIGQITTNLANKIWQKITMIDGLHQNRMPLPTGVPSPASAADQGTS